MNQTCHGMCKTEPAPKERLSEAKGIVGKGNTPAWVLSRQVNIPTKGNISWKYFISICF